MLNAVSLNALYTFEAVARHGSFKKAAQELHLSSTAVSHRIRTLEEQLGFKLFIRHARAISLSHQGQVLFDSIALHLQHIHHTIDRLRLSRQRVSLSVTPEFASYWLMPHLSAFQQAYPDIDLRIHTSYQVMALDTGEIDFAIRYGGTGREGMESVALFQEFFAPMVNHSLVVDEECCQWRLIHLDWHSPHHSISWAAWGEKTKENAAHALDMIGWQRTLAKGIHYNDGNQMILAVLAGMGVGLLGVNVLAKLLDDGLLRQVSQTTIEGQSFYLCHQNREPLTHHQNIVKSWLLQIATTKAGVSHAKC